MAETSRASIDGFNRLTDADARRLLESCLAVPRWIDTVAAGRPYGDPGAALEAAARAAASLSGAEVDAALTRHPRIGERAGSGHDAELSSREQAGVDTSDAAARDELARGNREYEARFGRVFLIRAAGRSSAEILAELRRRLQNGPDEEAAEVAEQLREIALLRLQQYLEGGPGKSP
jgi:OHCU decarboxylase